LLSLIDSVIDSNMQSAIVNSSDHKERTGYISCPLRLYKNTVYKYSTYTMAAWQENSAFKSTLRKLLLGAILAFLAPQSFARPALWYWWVGLTASDRVCAQTSPGAGWVRENTAFKDSHCSIRVKPF
jgi:hypothetical protein